MAKIRFDNGQVVNFNGNPTPEDVEYVAQQLGIKPSNSVEAQKEERKKAGLPISNRSDRAEPTGGGNLVRGIVKPFANLAVTAAGQKPNEVTKSNYLGDLKGISGGYDPYSIKGLKENFKTGIDIGTTVAGGPEIAGATGLAKQGFKEGVKSVVKQLPRLVKGGAAIGGIQGVSNEINSGNSLPESALNIGKSALIGGIVEPALGSISAIGGAAARKGLNKAEEVIGAINPTTKTLENDISRYTSQALAPRGAKTLGQLQNQTRQKVEGIKLLQEKSPTIKVLDEDGFVKPYEPENATLYETLQAHGAAKKQVVDEMTKQLQQAAEAGVTVDFTPTYSFLEDQAKNGIDRESRKIAENFMDELNEFRQIHGSDPSKLHDFIEIQNRKLAGKYKQGTVDETTKVALENLRSALDSVVDRSSYGKQYGDLKSLEQDLVREVQRLARQKGSGLEQFADTFANSDIVAAFISQNPYLFAKALVTKTLFKKLRASKEPERMLQKAFKSARQLQEKSRVKSTKSVKPVTEHNLIQNVKDYQTNDKLNNEHISRKNVTNVGDSTKIPTESSIIKNIITRNSGSPDARFNEVVNNQIPLKDLLKQFKMSPRQA